MPTFGEVEAAVDSGEWKLRELEEKIAEEMHPEFFGEVKNKYSLSRDEWDKLQGVWRRSCEMGAEFRRRWIENAAKKKLDGFAPSAGFFNLSPPNKRIENPIGTAKISVYQTLPIYVKGIETRWQRELINAGRAIEHADGLYQPSLAVDFDTLEAIAYGSRVLEEVRAMVVRDGIARSILLEAKDMESANLLGEWVGLHSNEIREIVYESDRLHNCQLKEYQMFQIGSSLHIRMVADTKDAMGMNMLTQASADVGEWVQANAPKEWGVNYRTVSSNMCCDKKPSSITLILGRGKTVTAEAVIADDDLKGFGINSRELYNYLVGETDKMAESVPAGERYNQARKVICGFFVHGQDLAQTVESSNFIQEFKLMDNALKYSIELPSLEIASFGGGSTTPSAVKYLSEIGCSGSGKVIKLAEVIAGTVLAAEIGDKIRGCSKNGVDYAPPDPGIAEIPVGSAHYKNKVFLLGTTETALIGAVNAGLKALENASNFAVGVGGVGGKYRIETEALIPSSYFENDPKHSTTAREIANLIQSKCWTGSAKAGGGIGSENTNAANTVAAIHVAYAQPLDLIKPNSRCRISAQLEERGGDEYLKFKVVLPDVQLNTDNIPEYAAQALGITNCRGERFAGEVYAPVVTALELRTTWTQAAHTLAKSHTGMTKS